MNRDRMRRSQWNHSYTPLPDDLVEETNEQLTSELKDKIHALKSLSIDIGQEVKYQDKVLGDLDEDFDRTGGYLGNTMNRVIRMARASHNYYIWYLFVFSIVVFFILYFVIKFR